MKLKKINIETINKEELVFINGGTLKDSKKKDECHTCDSFNSDHFNS
jgi:hypothetical protein|tara:strand:+ start:36 stop:176 length:141 start_codon:yes stop_codon:yes gene_type:complete